MPCGKRCYTSRKAAKDAVRNMHETVRVYACGQCKGAYHTTQERYGKGHTNSRAWNAKASRGLKQKRKA